MQSLLDRWRADTPGCAGIIHLNNAGAALMPRPVVSAIIDHLQREAAFGGYESAADASASIGDAYESVARLIGAQARNVAIVENATVAFFQALSAFDFRPSDVIVDEILVTAPDHYVHQEAIRLAVERTGATWRKIPLFDSHDAISADEIVDRIRKAIRPNLVCARHLRNSEQAG